jgi:hypothetical protein
MPVRIKKSRMPLKKNVKQAVDYLKNPMVLFFFMMRPDLVFSSRGAPELRNKKWLNSNLTCGTNILGGSVLFKCSGFPGQAGE